jgi:hypothetical protein
MNSQYEDIDRAIDEFRRAVARLFDDPLDRKIALLQSQIAARTRARRSTEDYRKKLCELMRQKIERELVAA